MEALSRIIQPISPAEYHAVCEMSREAYAKTELLEGIIIKKMTKSPLHSRIFSRLCRFLYTALDASYWIRPELPLSLEDSEPEPDISLLRGSEEDYPDRHPDYADLVIEIAVTSLEVDRIKARAYARAGIPEYWIVIPERKIIEAYSEPQGDAYRRERILESGMDLESPLGFVLRLEDLFRA